jgi:5-methylthioadenosine/S-adenosylhomocysteine deaminase
MRNLRKHIVLAILLLLNFCSVSQAQQSQTLVLHGTVVTPDEVIADGFVAVQGEKITQVGQFANKPAGTVVETNSVIFPGLIDLHNHITWNLLPRWRQNVEFSTRYDWQQRTAYAIALSSPHAQLFREGMSCMSNRYGEVKAIIGGATSVVGSLGPSRGANDNACIAGLARNLDFYSGFYGKELNQEKLRYEVFPLQVSADQANQIRTDLNSGKLTSYIVHLSEGKPDNASAAREFNMFQVQGFLRSGVSIIHGVAFGRAQFKQLAANGVGLIWSPRSNIELYGVTTDVATAKQEGVKIAIAPDWSPSGSDGLLQELKYVATWNAGQFPPVFSDDELVKMTTLYPAQLAKVDDKIGSIKAGLYADLLLIKKPEGNAYQALLRANPTEVRLVIINGVAVYGDTDLMKEFARGQQLQSLTLCGVPKALFIEPVSGVPVSWNEVTTTLDAKLNRWGSSLAPLTQCSSTNQN